MSSTTPRTPRGSARERLLAAAAQLFSRKGINATGVEAIATCAGVTKATLYNNFRSKDELVAEYLRARLEDTRAALAQGDDPGERADERVRSIFDALIADIVEGRFYGCPFAKAAVEVPGNSAAMAVVREHHDLFIRHLTEVAANPDVADTIAMIYDGSIVAAKATGGAAPVERAREAAASLVQSGPRR